jgi:hypothetical protein
MRAFTRNVPSGIVTLWAGTVLRTRKSLSSSFPAPFHRALNRVTPSTLDAMHPLSELDPSALAQGELPTMIIQIVLAQRQTKQPLYKGVPHRRPWSVWDISPRPERIFQATDG